MTETVEASTGADASSAPVTDAATVRRRKTGGGLEGMLLPELKQLAGTLGIKGTGALRKGQLIEAIKAAQSGGGAPASAGRSARSNQPTLDEAAAEPVVKAAAPVQEAPQREGGSRRARAEAAEQNGAAKVEAPPSTPLAAQNGSASVESASAPEQSQNGPAPEQNSERNSEHNSDRGEGRGGQNRDGDNRDRNRGREGQRNENRDGQRNESREGQRNENRNDNRGGQNDRQDRGPDRGEDGDGRRRRRRGRDRDRGGRDSGPRDSGRDSGRANRGRNERFEPEPTVNEDDILVPAAGILDVLDNYAFVRTSGYLPGPNDVYVALSMVKRYGLRKGDAITGAVKQPQDGERKEKFNPLVRIDTVNGADPDAAKHRQDFSKLTPLYATERLRLETEQNILITRIADIVTPIGKGQRGLIVSPPKAGKTMVLQALANAITTNNPEVHLMVVLVDERPEEVTDMQR
ncbi:MAG: transcription termination factor Rho, partial [Kribbellaceae bacterium]|nr:transcription termination factor Rho [Kribbellaceae bacterium]